MLAFTEQSDAERNVLSQSLCRTHDHTLSTYNDPEVFGIQVSLTCAICDIFYISGGLMKEKMTDFLKEPSN